MIAMPIITKYIDSEIILDDKMLRLLMDTIFARVKINVTSNMGGGKSINEIKDVVRIEEMKA